jgi:hypothetical protein
MRSQTVQNLKLVLQASDTVMVPKGEVPSLLGPSDGMIDNWLGVLVMAVNFIRCGAPEVCIVSEYVLQGIKQRRTESLDNMLRELNRTLGCMSSGCIIRSWNMGQGVLFVEKIQKE